MEKIPLLKDFNNEKEYMIKLREYCIKNSINEVKNHLNNEDIIGVYVKFIESIDEIINSWFETTFELFTLYNPEASVKLKDLNSFLKKVIMDKKELKRVYNEKYESMGINFSKKDEYLLKSSIEELNNLVKKKELFEIRAKELAKEIAPITTKVAGELVTAKLLTLSKGLKKLMLMPSSTIQVLGAEKALFRHLVTNKKARPPKYGVIFYSEWINLAKDDDKGKMARALASKISISSKLDYFKGEDISEELINSLKKKLEVLK